MASHLMKLTDEKKPLVNADSRSSTKSATEISFNEKRSKGFSSRKAHITFFRFFFEHEAAANVPLTLIMNHLALHNSSRFIMKYEHRRTSR